MSRHIFTSACIAGVIVLAPMATHAAVSDWQRSVSIIPSSATDFGSSNYMQTVDRFKSLGFNYVTLIIPLYQATSRSIDIVPASNTPTGPALSAAIQYAHSKGMGVTLKIHLDPGDGVWRSHLNPDNRDAWFADYKYHVYKYAALAQKNGVESYCIGTELISMASDTVDPKNTTQWKSMITSIRTIYTGKLFYDATWGGSAYANEPPQIAFWGDLDYMGLSAYYPLPGDGSVASLKSNWDRINTNTIKPLYDRYKKPILFAEIGYRSIAEAHEHPWAWWYLPEPYSAQEQINDYTALIEYWNQYPYMRGIGLWNALTSPNSGGEGDLDFLIQRKPVEETFKRLFGVTNPGASVVATGSVSPTTMLGAQLATLTAYVTSKGATLTDTNVDLELYDATNKQVFQRIFRAITLTSDQQQQFTTKWTTSTKGLYTLKIGVFSADWSKLYIWNNAAATLQVN
jgi:hypothetical protein